MRLLITGLRGTLAPKLARAAEVRQWQVLGWPRDEVDPAAREASSRFLSQARPEAIAHLAMGDAAWAADLARFAHAARLPLVFTSTAMVFHHEPDGPHAPGDERTARDDYGLAKIRCEDALLAACPAATVARIGWQIDADARGNNMLAHLDQWQQREGRVGASRLWHPACSFMADTAAALIELIERPVAGVVHLDSNAEEGHGFDRIALALQRQFGRDGWKVEAIDGYRHDQRLAGDAARMPPLGLRLPLDER